MSSSERKYPHSENSSPESCLGRCLVDSTPDSALRGQLSRRKAFGASLAFESLAVVLLVASPIFTGVAQPQIHQLLPPGLTFFGPWHEHDTGPRRPVPTVAHSLAFPDPFLNFAPPRPIADARPAEGPGNFPGTDAPGISVPGIPQITGMGQALRSPEPPHFVAPRQPERGPVKLSAGVVAAQLISRVEPRYPPLAIETRQSGTVVLHAIISREGRIESLEVVSGSPFFAQAALDAVRQWRYRPTLLDGEPVEVETTITVEFRLQR